MQASLSGDNAASLHWQGQLSLQREGTVTRMPSNDLPSCLALPQHLKGLEVLPVLGLPTKQSKKQGVRICRSRYRQTPLSGAPGFGTSGGSSVLASYL